MSSEVIAESEVQSLRNVFGVSSDGPFGVFSRLTASALSRRSPRKIAASHLSHRALPFKTKGKSMKNISSSQQGAVEGAVPAVRSPTSKKAASTPSETQEQYRVVITKEANDCLEGAVEKVNRDLTGAVSRSDLANYVFLNLAKLLSDADLKALRALHFDEKKVLGTILKSDEDLPDELRRALREYYGISESGKKRSLRVAPELSVEKSDDGPSAA